MASIVGIDLSLRSPGVALWNQGVWTIWCFATRKREVGLKWISPDRQVSVQTLAPIPSSKSSDILRYQHIVREIETHCFPCWAADSQIYLEDYIFPKAAVSGSAYKIHELGGILKYTLHLSGFAYQSVAPSVWKKKISGNHHLSKLQTLQHVQRQIPQLDLLTLFGLNSSGEPPSPVQDMADAMGVVLAAMDN